MSEENLRVLIIEDDDKLARLVGAFLEMHGLVVFYATSGRDGLRDALRLEPDCVLLDLGLPGMSGFEVCRELRKRSDVSIIMVTADGAESNRVLGLEDGADDYLAKPFSSRELLARIRAVVRRARRAVVQSASVVEVGSLRLEPASMRATWKSADLSLTTHEFALLRVLVEHAGQVLTREQLIGLTLTGEGEVFDRAIDVRVSRLRQKLGDDPKQPRYLKTVRGSGYLLVRDLD